MDRHEEHTVNRIWAKQTAVDLMRKLDHISADLVRDADRFREQDNEWDQQDALSLARLYEELAEKAAAIADAIPTSD